MAHGSYNLLERINALQYLLPNASEGNGVDAAAATTMSHTLQARWVVNRGHITSERVQHFVNVVKVA